MPPSAEAKRRHQQQRRPKPDEWGYLGVLNDGTYPGTAENGYIFAVSYHPGYTFARIRHGLSFEVAEVIAPTTPHDPDLQLGFQRIAGVLVAMAPNALGAVAGYGVEIPEAYVPPHTHDAAVLTYTPADAADWDTVPGFVGAALDELAGRTAEVELTFDRMMVDGNGDVMTDGNGNVMVAY